jgi:hypothetical protein
MNKEIQEVWIMDQFELFLHIVAMTMKHEDTNLRTSLQLSCEKKGIFTIPEPALVYLIAKAVVCASPLLFGCWDLRWRIERKLGNQGPSDLVIYPNKKRPIVIEFKMDVKKEKLLSDVAKLRLLDISEYQRLFCAIIGVYEEELPDPPRVLEIDHADSGTNRRLAKNFPRFSTFTSTGKNPLYCLVAGWEIL